MKENKQAIAQKDSPEEDVEFLNQQAVLCYNYMSRCRSLNKNPNKEFATLIIAILEAELMNLNNL